MQQHVCENGLSEKPRRLLVGEMSLSDTNKTIRNSAYGGLIMDKVNRNV